MSVPSLSVQTNGGPGVSGDQLNTYFQTCDTVSQLRSFTGITGIQVYIRGTTSIGDGGQGIFYWNAAGTAPDDNGTTTIVPSGSTSGEWTRLGGTGSSLAALTVTGNGTIGGTLSVTGATSLTSLAVSGNETVGGTLRVTGTLTGAGISGTVVSASTSLKLNNSPVLDKITTQSITSSGTYTPTTGMVYCIIELVGAGAGGLSGSAGGGGGAGGYNRGLFTASTVGTSQTVTVGSGGSAGNNGGLSAVGSLIAAAGGNASTSGSSNSAMVWTPGGQGGTSFSGGILTVTGGCGLPGLQWDIASNLSGQSGKGGDSMWGSGGLAVTSGGASTNGNAGTGYGSGGSGAIYGGTGGAGAPGGVLITEFLSA